MSPSGIELLRKTAKSISIKWTQAPTCYERAGIVVRLYNPENKTTEYKVHKDATTYDITGLSPSTSYWFQMFTKYGNDTHNEESVNPDTFPFKTNAPDTSKNYSTSIGFYT